MVFIICFPRKSVGGVVTLLLVSLTPGATWSRLVADYNLPLDLSSYKQRWLTHHCQWEDGECIFLVQVSTHAFQEKIDSRELEVPGFLIGRSQMLQCDWQAMSSTRQYELHLPVLFPG